MNSRLITCTLTCLVGLATVAEACPTCKLALGHGAEHSQQAYAYSILFMMTMPFLIMSGWALFVIRSVHRPIHNEGIEDAGQSKA